MIQTSSLQIVCRPALTRDRADVIEFCKGIWDGDDYVPEVWDDWFNDPNGILGVAEINGHAVACSKISLISKGQWWLEGFRVDPKVQGYRVGSRIHDFVTDWWLEHGDGTLRLMTSSENLAVHHVCLKTGFFKTHEICAYKATPIAESTGSFSSVTDLSEAASFAIAAESIKTTNRLIDLGWRIAKPNEQVFEIYSNENAGFIHKFYWWKGKQGLFSAWKDEDRLEDAGFEKHWKEHNAFIFEKEHPA